MKTKNITLNIKTSDMLDAIKEKRKEELNPARTKADIVHELVTKAYKKEVQE